MFAGGTLHDGGVEFVAEFFELVDVGADDQGLLARMLRQDRLDDVHLGVGGGAELVLGVVLGDRVLQAFLVGEGDAHLDAIGGRDPALGFDVLPRGVVALGADEAEHIALAAVLTHQGGGQSEAPS